MVRISISTLSTSPTSVRNGVYKIRHLHLLLSVRVPIHQVQMSDLLIYIVLIGNPWVIQQVQIIYDSSMWFHTLTRQQHANNMGCKMTIWWYSHVNCLFIYIFMLECLRLNENLMVAFPFAWNLKVLLSHRTEFVKLFVLNFWFECSTFWFQALRILKGPYDIIRTGHHVNGICTKYRITRVRTYCLNFLPFLLFLQPYLSIFLYTNLND